MTAFACVILVPVQELVLAELVLVELVTVLPALPEHVGFKLPLVGLVQA